MREQRIDRETLNRLRANMDTAPNTVFGFVYPSTERFEAYGPDAIAFNDGQLTELAVGDEVTQTSTHLYAVDMTTGHERAAQLSETRPVLVLNGDDLLAAIAEEIK